MAKDITKVDPVKLKRVEDNGSASHFSEMSYDQLISEYNKLKRKVRKSFWSGVNKYPDGFLAIEYEINSRYAAKVMEREKRRAAHRNEISALDRDTEYNKLTIRGIREYHANELCNTPEFSYQEGGKK